MGPSDRAKRDVLALLCVLKLLLETRALVWTDLSFWMHLDQRPPGSTSDGSFPINQKVCVFIVCFTHNEGINHFVGL